MNSPSYITTGLSGCQSSVTSGLTLTGGHTGTVTWTSPVPAATHTFDTDIEVKSDIKIKGVSLSETLAKIEERLAILKPNTELEHRWEILKKLGDEYRKLEKEILEKEAILDILKK